jgi:hypothetical protein
VGHYFLSNRRHPKNHNTFLHPKNQCIFKNLSKIEISSATFQFDMAVDHFYYSQHLNWATGRSCRMIAVKCLRINCDEFNEPHSTAPCLSNMSYVSEIVHLSRSNPQRFEGRICLRLQMEKERWNLIWWAIQKEFVSLYCSNITAYLLYASRCQVVCCLY